METLSNSDISMMVIKVGQIIQDDPGAHDTPTYGTIPNCGPWMVSGFLGIAAAAAVLLTQGSFGKACAQLSVAVVTTTNNNDAQWSHDEE